MSAPSNRDRIQRARRGDADAFGELVLRYQRSVFNVCYRLLHEWAEAEDMTQETFLRVRERLGTFDRDVLSEILVKRLNNPATTEIFPEYEPRTLNIMK